MILLDQLLHIHRRQNHLLAIHRLEPGRPRPG
jgi:hypothetical protein